MPTASPPEYLMKHRLVGAVILVGVAVVVVPWLLMTPASNGYDGRVRTVRSVPHPVIETVPIAELNRQAQPATPTVSSKPATVTPVKPTVTAKSATVTPAATAKKTTPAAPKSANPTQWEARVGTYRVPANVRKIKALLAKHGLKARTTALKTDSGTAIRVWLGPYPRKVDAEKIRSRVEKISKEKGLVIKHKRQ